MRRFDKKYNMEKVNLLAEQRYLKLISESELEEYDYNKFKSDYSGMDKDKMDALISKGKERQIRDGIKLNFKADTMEGSLFITPSDIHLYKPNLDLFKKAPSMIDKLRGTTVDDFYATNKGDKDFRDAMRIIDIKNKKYEDEIKFTFTFTVENCLIVSSNNNLDEISIDGQLNVILSPLNDKDKPPFSMDVKGVKLYKTNFADRFIPDSRKDANNLAKTISKLLIEEYGKFDFNKPLFIPAENIKIHPNSFIK